jgi:hypothetical protein
MEFSFSYISSKENLNTTGNVAIRNSCSRQAKPAFTIA